MSSNNPHRELETIVIPAGRWVRFDHKGPYQSIWQTWSKIYSYWVIPNGIKLRDSLAFDRYINDPRENNSDDLMTHIYLPI